MNHRKSIQGKQIIKIRKLAGILLLSKVNKTFLRKCALEKQEENPLRNVIFYCIICENSAEEAYNFEIIFLIFLFPVKASKINVQDTSLKCYIHRFNSINEAKSVFIQFSMHCNSTGYYDANGILMELN